VPERGLFALAEGDSASAVVAEALRSAIESAPPLSSSLRRKGVPLLVTAIEQANTAVFNVGRSHPAVRKSGVSLATALVAGQKAVIASLGDSAIYRLRRGALERLAIGAGSGGDAAPKARASVAPRSRGAKPQAPRRPALGQRKALEVETSIVTIQPADTLLLCTPRFRAALPLEEMSAILLRCADPNAAASELATRAGDAMDGLALVIQVEG